MLSDKVVGVSCLKGPRITFTRGRRSRNQRRVLIQEILSLMVSESIKKIYKEAAVFEENVGTTRAPASTPPAPRTEVERRPKMQVNGPCLQPGASPSFPPPPHCLPATPSIRSPRGIANSPRGLIGFPFQEPVVPLVARALSYSFTSCFGVTQ